MQPDQITPFSGKTLKFSFYFCRYDFKLIKIDVKSTVYSSLGCSGALFRL